MKVHITFDIEVWCDGWTQLDERFPAAFRRYCYGESAAGQYALPKTIEIMQRHDLQGVFFVEPLFSARFGAQWLETIVRLIQHGGQDVQLHLHPEWTDEIRPALIGDVSRKRQHLTHYSAQEQATLIGHGQRLLEAAKGAPVTVFRAGSFAANADTYRALQQIGISLDSSLNSTYDYSLGTIQDVRRFSSRRVIEGVEVYPVTVMSDGFGRMRSAQVNGCAFAEMRDALLTAQRAGVERFVIVSHNFDMLRQDSTQPDWAVVRRFEALCRFLADRDDLFEVEPFPTAPTGLPERIEARPSVGPLPTAQRWIEQAMRRVVAR